LNKNPFCDDSERERSNAKKRNLKSSKIFPSTLEVLHFKNVYSPSSCFARCHPHSVDSSAANVIQFIKVTSSRGKNVFDIEVTTDAALNAATLLQLQEDK